MTLRNALPTRAMVVRMAVMFYQQRVKAVLMLVAAFTTKFPGSIQHTKS